MLKLKCILGNYIFELCNEVNASVEELEKNGNKVKDIKVVDRKTAYIVYEEKE